jgi:hypothetical protein
MHISPVHQVEARLSLMLALIVAVLLSSTSTASAEVIDVGNMTFTNVVTNPCDPADGPITFTTDSHFVFQLQPDGSRINHITFISRGVSTNGTSYVANRVSVQTAPPGSTTFTVDAHLLRISNGAGDNAMIEITGTIPGPLTMTVRCVG